MPPTKPIPESSRGALLLASLSFWPQGPFDLDSCMSKHSINPYGSRESRVLFSTWNLDHV
jgi:hypothetical protein